MRTLDHITGKGRCGDMTGSAKAESAPVTNPPAFCVVYASDDRGVVPLGVAVYSLLAHAAGNTRYKVCILSNGISDENQHRISTLAQGKHARHAIVFVNVSDLAAMRDLPTNEKWPIAAWSRVFIPDLLLDAQGVILYCDIDTLVCRDLEALFHTPLNGKAIGVVLEHVSHAHSHFNQRLDIPMECPGYFNSGVMLMDLCVFRQQNLVERIVQYAATHRDKLTCPDQDALNGALCNNLQPIHHKWNWHDGLTRLILKRTLKTRLSRGASLEDSVESALRPGILHYQGPNKPWRYNYRIERKRYEDAIRGSGFGEYPLPGKTFAKWFKSILHAPVYWVTRAKIRRFDLHFQRLHHAVRTQPSNLTGNQELL